MIVYALIEDEDDSYDTGSHDAVMQLFIDCAEAERVMAELIGKQRFVNASRSRRTWYRSDLCVQEMTVW